MHTSKNLRLYLIVLVALAAAFVFGRITAPSSKAPARGIDKPTPADGVPVASRDKPTTDELLPGTTDTLTRALNVRPMSGQEPTPVMRGQELIAPRKKFSQQDLLNSLQDTDPVQSAIAFAATLETIDATNIRHAIEVFESMPNLSSHQHEYSLLLYKWATLDGPAAIAHVREMDGSWQRRRYTYEALSGWAATDPDAALDWANENHDGPDNPYLPGVIGGLARRDIDRASELLQSLPYGRNRGRAASVVVDSYMRLGAKEAMTWAENLEDEVLKKGIIPRVAYRYALEDAEGAANWQLSVTADKDKENTLSTITRYWTYSQPEKAANWVTGITDQELRGHGMESVSRAWANRDPVATVDWIKGQDDSSDKDRAIVGLANGIRRTNPEYALEWAGRISDVDLKKETVGKLFQNWMEQDPEKAKAYLNTPE